MLSRSRLIAYCQAHSPKLRNNDQLFYLFCLKSLPTTATVIRQLTVVINYADPAAQGKFIVAIPGRQYGSVVLQKQEHRSYISRTADNMRSVNNLIPPAKRTNKQFFRYRCMIECHYTPKYNTGVPRIGPTYRIYLIQVKIFQTFLSIYQYLIGYAFHRTHS